MSQDIYAAIQKRSGRPRKIITLSYEGMYDWDFARRFGFVNNQLNIYDESAAAREVNRVLASTGSSLRVDRTTIIYYLRGKKVA